MVGLHDLFSADRAPTLGLGEGFRQRVTVGRRRKTSRVKTDFRRAVGTPHWAEALETGSRTQPKWVPPKFKLRLMLAAYIFSYCCTKVSYTSAAAAGMLHKPTPLS